MSRRPLARLPLSGRRRLLFALIACTILLSCFILKFTSYTDPADVDFVLFDKHLPIPNSSSPPASSPPKRPAPKVLLVSAFYPLSKSKHTLDDYTAWLSRFLGCIFTDVYMFTTPEMEPHIRAVHLSSGNCGGSHESHSSSKTPAPPRLTINTTYPSAMSIPPLLPHTKKYEMMYSWDRENYRHSPELYAIWNAKPWFLREGLHNANSTQEGDQHEYDYAFWTDAGSFRNTHGFRSWPSPARVVDVFTHAQASSKGEDRIFIPLNTPPDWTPSLTRWKAPMGPIDTPADISEGSFFGGRPAALDWYQHAFYTYHDRYISTPPNSDQEYPPFHFVGKDQTVINAILFAHPQRFFTMFSPLQTPLLSTLIPESAADQAELPTPTWSFRAKFIRHRIKLASVLGNYIRGQGHNPCGNDWFYYQFWLASPHDRRETRKIWSESGTEGSFRKNIAKWWDETILGLGGGESEAKGTGDEWDQKGCPITPVVAMERVVGVGNNRAPLDL